MSLNDIKLLTISSKFQSMMAKKSLSGLQGKWIDVFKRTIKRLVRIQRFAYMSNQTINAPDVDLYNLTRAYIKYNLIKEGKEITD